MSSFLVIASFTASGDVSDFDESMKADILETLAQLAGFEFLPLGSTIEVIAGSVKVVAKFPVATWQKASSAQDKLFEAATSTTLANGIYTESTFMVEIEEGREQRQSSSPASSSAVAVVATAAGAVVAAATIVGVYIFIKRTGGIPSTAASPSAGETEATVAVEEANAVANIKAMERVYSLRI